MGRKKQFTRYKSPSIYDPNSVLSPEEYQQHRTVFPVDFILESDNQGFSLVSKGAREGARRYFFENWLRVTLPHSGAKGLKLVDREPISVKKRNEMKKEAQYRGMI